MNIGKVSFGAQIDKNTFNFLLKAREKGLYTKEMETLLKQVYPEDGYVYSANDDLGKGIAYMKVSGKTILPSRFKYIQHANFIQTIPYDISQDTINIATKSLEKIKSEDRTANNMKINVPKIYKRDHEAELKKIFRMPAGNIYRNSVIERD